MKFFKSTLAIVVLCTTNSMFAARGGVVAPKGKTPRGGAVIPAKTYKQLVDDVKNAGDAWNNTTKKLNASFTDRIASGALAADLEDYQLDSLLQTARDYHAIFTGNPSEDRNLLNSLAQERQAIVEWFNMGKKQTTEQ